MSENADLTWGDELVHNLMHTAQQQVGTPVVCIPAHIAAYDPRTNMVTCLIPHYYSVEAGENIVTGYIPLATIAAGPGIGMQYAPFGGSTQQNPTAGEQVWLLMINSEINLYICAVMTWNNVKAPPNPGINAGELCYIDHFGNQVYLQSGGTLLVSGGSTVNVNAPTINATGETVNVTADNIYLGSQGETLQTLVTQAFQALFNEHTHPAPNGETGVPNQQMTSEQLTTVVKAG